MFRPVKSIWSSDDITLTDCKNGAGREAGKSMKRKSWQRGKFASASRICSQASEGIGTRAGCAGLPSAIVASQPRRTRHDDPGDVFWNMSVAAVGVKPRRACGRDSQSAVTPPFGSFVLRPGRPEGLQPTASDTALITDKHGGSTNAGTFTPICKCLPHHFTTRIYAARNTLWGHAHRHKRPEARRGRPGRVRWPVTAQNAPLLSEAPPPTGTTPRSHHAINTPRRGGARTTPPTAVTAHGTAPRQNPRPLSLSESALTTPTESRSLQLSIQAGCGGGASHSSVLTTPAVIGARQARGSSDADEISGGPVPRKRAMFGTPSGYATTSPRLAVRPGL
ncbi:hypothetical protein SKAU_G00162150 [Synaphobranchus kaupii]|uniref:Uncharacterized protein n=1 Tax=Synaphobranchus kaupii TaxID=118154 RepID=A0A9Q1FJB0_SYNKA|nr:hypothetical protein SKAU_G00162150 [Synaphobranchus kaupii]